MPNLPPRHRAGRSAEKVRGNSAARGYGWRWRQTRLAFLRQHPYCVLCRVAGRVTQATQVDHIEPHRGDAALFWDFGNLQPLCGRCHSAKTASGG